MHQSGISQLDQFAVVGQVDRAEELVVQADLDAAILGKRGEILGRSEQGQDICQVPGAISIPSKPSADWYSRMLSQSE